MKEVEGKEDDISSLEDSSDDDLPEILPKSPNKQLIKPATQILTPRRSIKPVEIVGSPLLNSPSSTVGLLENGENARKKQKKSRVSITDLLKEKERDDEIQNKLNDIIKMEGIQKFILD